jgi:hypothetical protein
MRKFEIPSKQSKKAYPRAEHKGQEVRVRGVDRLDESRRVYYSVQPVHKRSMASVQSVRCDKLSLIA